MLFSLVALAAFLGSALAWGIWWQFTASLPRRDGVVTMPELSAPVRIERDEQGIPRLIASNRLDLARATGFVHGQDRFFQMDLLRRHPAGELAGLVGKAALAEDRRMRVHRFRARAREQIRGATAEERELLRAYAEGVEAGRQSLTRVPWEYLLLGSSPKPWEEEDTVLVVFGMYQMLQGNGIASERAQGLVEELLPTALAAFLTPEGSIWDAPLRGGGLPLPRVPRVEEVDLRKRPGEWQVPVDPRRIPTVRRGSNSWAVAGKRSAHGGALLANDMHLGLMVPGIWYRASFVWKEGEEQRQVHGVTLPGAPAMVVGSNTHVAWGFTNSEGDYMDLMLLEETDETPRRRYEETLEVAGGPNETMTVEETDWGPIIGRDRKGRLEALRWVAHLPGAVNLELMKLEKAKNLEEVLAIAPRCGTPTQNLLVVDRQGRIAWTLLGRIPQRIGFDGQRPILAKEKNKRWGGWLAASEYPRIVEPEEGLLWTANNRVVDEPDLSRIGRRNFDHGARARQIRDGLRSRPVLSEKDMLAIQLDDRALFLERWQRVLVEVLKGAPTARREALRQAVENWGGRASIDSVGFRLVRRWRQLISQLVLGSLTAPCWRAEPGRFHMGHLDANVEESVWLLVTQRPAHLLPPPYESWEALLLDAVEKLGNEVQGREETLEEGLARYSWGAANTARIRHPLSGALGPLGRWLRLDMKEEPLPGDGRAMPRIQAPSEGASQRMAVSPGREEEGYFHMPAGQSGHPISPNYRDGHAAWVCGEGTAFLPGPARDVLELRP